jgi:hypothetical protein
MEWPGTLPTDPLYGWSEVPGDGSVRTETDSGPAKMRRRFTSAPSVFSLQFSMTTDQATRLMQFYTNSSSDSPAGTASGSLTFGTLGHPRTGVAPTSTETTGWRFLSPPVITQSTYGYFNAVVQLELLE